MKQRYFIVDAETTGLAAVRGDRVIEIGAVLMQGRQVMDEFHSLIDTGYSIHWVARRVHGIFE